MSKIKLTERNDKSSSIKSKSKIKNKPIKKAKISKVLKKGENKKVKQERKVKSKFNPKLVREKGVVYLSHIPHGFYEEQIESYFAQFGKVTSVSLPRSKLGKSKGYAFIEFSHPEVAEIAAETMNNYLMFNRVLKAKYIPPEKQKPFLFQIAESSQLNKTTIADRTKRQIIQNRKLKNRSLKSELEAKKLAKLIWQEKRTKNALKKMGIEYDFEVQKDGVEAVFERRNKLREKKRNASLDASGNQSTADEDQTSSESTNENSSSEEEKEILISAKELSKNKKLINKISKHTDKNKLNQTKLSKTDDILKENIITPRNKAKILPHSENKKDSLTNMIEKQEDSQLKSTQKSKRSLLIQNNKEENLLENSKTPISIPAVDKLKTPKRLKSTPSTPKLQKNKELIIEENLLENSKTPISIPAVDKLKTPKRLKSTPSTPKLQKSKELAIEENLLENIKTPSVPKVEKLKTSKRLKSSPSTPNLQRKKELVMEVDANDEEISFKTPPNVVKKFIVSQQPSGKNTPSEKKTPSILSSPKERSSVKKLKQRKSTLLTEEVKTTPTISKSSVKTKSTTPGKLHSAKKSKRESSCLINSPGDTSMSLTPSAKNTKTRKSALLSPKQETEAKTPKSPFKAKKGSSPRIKKPRHRSLKRLSSAQN